MSTTTIPASQRADRLATILSPREETRLAAVTASIGTCYACGTGYIDDGHGDQFCSTRCAAFIAQDGMPKHLQARFVPPAAHRLGRRGVYRDCMGCGGEFESLGLAYCPACYARRPKDDDCAYPDGRQSAAGVVKRQKRAIIPAAQKQPRSALKTKGNSRHPARGTRLELLRSKGRERQRRARMKTRAAA